ncbi:conserved exported hypothetical protein [Flavobacterium sp. 9AF]|uniref:hypothetical protein n=1 Tax=Flavobacterium sp. 9AF TaxID=2653142 RepID=UPI0012F32D80|nr:hypothetical protein [Flavobacterium sp. 9AF]VXC40613.1 conserved exported hypothetical protein [Flavobacterium sp. 9AF]
MKKLFLSLLIFLSLSCLCFSQNPTFKWNETSTPIENELNFNIQHFFDGKRVFFVKSKYNEKIFNKDVFVDIYDSRDDFEKDDADFSVGLEQPVMGKNPKTVSFLFHLIDKDYVYFLTEYNNKIKEYELSTETVNFDTGTKSENVFIAKMSAKNMFNIGDFFVAQSENKKYYGLVSRPLGDKKLNENATLMILDTNFKIVKTLDYSFNFTTKQSFDINLHVTNNGNLILIREIDLPKTKAYKSLFYWNSSTNSVNEHSLKQDLDYPLTQFKFKENDSETYFLGTISDGKNKPIVDLGGALPEGNPVVGFHYINFNKDGEVKINEKIKLERQRNLNFDNIILENRKLWVLFNEIYKGTKRLPSSDPSQPLNYNYEYSYISTGFSVIKLDLQTGKLDWFTRINNEEPKSLNDNGDFLKYLPFFKNNQLHLIYNDSRDINHNTKYFVKDSRFVVMSTINEEGAIVSTKDIQNSGVGKKHDFCYELDLSFALPVNETTYIVRSKCGNNSRFGYLSF